MVLFENHDGLPVEQLGGLPDLQPNEQSGKSGNTMRSTVAMASAIIKWLDVSAGLSAFFGRALTTVPANVGIEGRCAKQPAQSADHRLVMA